jgi:DNA-binding transcriptional regulator GbsR (MarR family)
MNLRRVKRDFIQYMEEVHGANPYPRNFFGCVMAISSESEPVSQDRIMELTGYSQATVSLAIQKIQLLLPIRAVKKKGDRRNYYVYDDAASSFVLDLLQRRVDVQDIDINLVDSTLEKSNNWNDEDETIIHFRRYLKNMRLYLNLIHQMRSASVEPFKQALSSGSLADLGLQDESVLARGALSEFILKLKKITSITEEELPDAEDYMSDGILLLKNEYFTGIKTYLNPLFSQAIANQLVVVHCVLLEGCVTQDQIARITLLPRSIISEVLAYAVKRGIVGVSGSRPKYYRPVVSFSDLMLASYDRVANYIVLVTNQLSWFIKRTREVRPKSKAITDFLDFLEELERAYKLARAFSINMKVQTVKQLRAEFEHGFEFI